ncbi:uncharacterized protein LOC18992748 [Eutrema salsugineum]|nr:uncharacterized protein LOC18992748 [Eutrema salsugineum]
MDDEAREIRQELRRLNVRLVVAISLAVFTGCYRSQAGLTNLSETMTNNTGHVAFYWASKFSKFARLCSLMVVFELLFVPVVVLRMRSLRRESDRFLVLASICVLISLSFLAYLRWFVVVV